MKIILDREYKKLVRFYTALSKSVDEEMALKKA
jgi:hypothetical protein